MKCCFARNLFIGSSEFKRNLNGYFGVARAQEIFEEIFVEMLLTQEIYSITREPKSLNKNP